MWCVKLSDSERDALRALIKEQVTQVGEDEVEGRLVGDLAAVLTSLTTGDVLFIKMIGFGMVVALMNLKLWELAGLALHRPAEPDPLDLALDHGLQPQLRAGHAWMVTGVPRGSFSASRLMVSLSMRTQPLDTGWPSSHGL